MDKEKCTKQLVQTAVMNARSLLNQQKEDQFTAKSATKSTESQDLAVAVAAEEEEGFN